MLLLFSLAIHNASDEQNERCSPENRQWHGALKPFAHSERLVDPENVAVPTGTRRQSSEKPGCWTG